MRKVRLFAIIFILLPQLWVVPTAAAKSSVWKISKGDDYFYLGGTFHLLSAADHPLPEAFSQAYSDAEEIILETDLAAAADEAFQQRMFASMMYQDGRTLSSELEKETYEQLAAFMEKRQLPIEQFTQFQPWGVSLMLTVEEYVAFGMVPEYGVDAHFAKKAVDDKKTLQSLEEPGQQLQFLSSLANIDPDLNINYTLRELEQLPELITELKKAWRAGDLHALENSASVVQLRDEFPEIYKTLIISRNNNWMQQINTLFDDNNIEIVLVGALHLVGKAGLLAQLKTQGFSLVQLD